MKRTILIVLAVMAASCSSVKPDAGQECVLTRKPMLFGKGGVDSTSVKTGRKYVAWTTDATCVTMQPFKHALHFDDLMTRDGVPLDFDATASFQVVDSVRLVTEFGVDGWFERNVEQPLRTAVRNSVKNHGMNETAIEATAAEQIDDEVTLALNALVVGTRVPVKVLDFTMGRANPPDSIKTQRTETAVQEQRINTEKQRKLAEDQRLSAEQSKAKADNAYREMMHLSPDQFLQLRSIDTLGWACAAKPGTCSFVTTGALPTLGVARK